MKKGVAVLPLEELTEALHAENRKDLAVAGTIDYGTQQLLLLFGDGSWAVVPLDEFQPSGGWGVAPDFDCFEIIDYGHTLKFGEYEASTCAVVAMKATREVQQ